MFKKKEYLVVYHDNGKHTYLGRVHVCVVIASSKRKAKKLFVDSRPDNVIIRIYCRKEESL